MRQERERRYVSEYLLEAYPDMQWQLNVELGPIPLEYITRHGLTRAAAMFRPTRPRVDAVRWTESEYILVEAKLRDIKAGIGDLMYYRTMVQATKDLPWYDGQKISYLLVIPWMLEWVQWAADEAGIEVVVFSPEWVEEYVRERQHYFTAAYRRERNEKMRLRRILGVE